MAEPDSILSLAKSRGKFYIYEHVREDTGQVFYVGKGSGYRATVTQHRNRYWMNVAAKSGWRHRVVFRTSDEELAFLAEEELIRHHKEIGSPLTNMTDGGEGTSGYVFDKSLAKRRAAYRIGVPNVAASIALKGRPKTKEHRRNLSIAHTGKRMSDEARKNMSAARKGRPSSMLGKSHTEEAKTKISMAVSGERNPFFGKSHPPEVVARIAAANRGRKMSTETRRKMSESKKGDKHPMFGKRPSDERIRKQRATLMARPKLKCPHCGTASSDGNAKRWHFDNCKRKP